MDPRGGEAQHPEGPEWAPCWLLCRSCWNRECGWLRRAEGESSSTTLPAWSTSTRSEFRIVLSLWAMVSTVLLAKRLQMVCWSSWSVFWSTLAAASSMHKIWTVCRREGKQEGRL